MLKKLWLALAFMISILLALLIVGCGGDDDDNGNGNGGSYSASDYFPLAVGWSWTYQDSGTYSIDTSSTEIVAIVEIGEQQYYAMTDDDGDTSYFLIQGGTVYAYDTEIDSNYLIIPATFGIGDSWIGMNMDSTDTAEMTITHSWMTQETEVQTTEDITVPAGSFSCLKILSTIEWGYQVSMNDSVLYSSSETETSYVWVSKNVGSIKEQSSDENISVLLNYTVGE